jgi:hypothetical protein
MPMNRRELVAIGGALGGAALLAAEAAGQAVGDGPAPVTKVSEASGRVASFGEGSSTYFTLSKMPEGIERFGVDSRICDRVGRLVLAAAEKGWEIHVTYLSYEGGKGGTVYDVRVKGFGAG